MTGPKCFIHPGQWVRQKIAVMVVLTVWALGATPLQAQLPTARLYAIFPLGGRQGTTVELAITSGEDLEGADQLHFSHPGITAVRKTQMVDGQDEPQPVPDQFVVTIAAEVPPGVYDVRASGTYGVSNPRAFVVSDINEVIENEPNDTFEQAAALEINSVVNGRSNGQADVDSYKVRLAEWQRLIVDCSAQRIDSRMDAVLVLYDSSGQELAYSDNFNHRDPLLDFTAGAEAEYFIKIADLLYNGSNEFFYRLRVTTLPYIDYVFPLSGPPGFTQEFTLFGLNLPGGTPAEGLSIDGQPLEWATAMVEVPGDRSRLESSRFIRPADSEVDGFDYRLRTEAGGSNPIFVSYATEPVVTEAEPNDSPAQAQQVSAPCEFAGQFQVSDDDDWVAFPVKPGDVYWIEAFSQRLGTLADLQMLVQLVTKDDQGQEKVNELTLQDDNGTNIGGLSYQTTTTDPSAYRLTAGAEGLCRIRLRDLAGPVRVDPRRVYRLSIRREQPDFRLVAMPVFPIPEQQDDPKPWSLLVRKGGTAKLGVFAFRQNGFGGEIELSVEGLPEGVRCPGAVIGPGQNSAPLVFTANEDAADWVGPIQAFGRAKIGDQEMRRQARGGTVIWPIQQGQPAESRMSRGLYLAVAQRAPFLVHADRGPRITLAQGHELYIPVKVTRRGEFKGDIALVPVGVPGNIQKENVTLKGNQAEAVMHLFVNNNAPVGTFTFYLQAATQVPFTKDPEGKNKTNVNVIEPSTPLIVTIVPAPVTLAPNVPDNGQVKRGEKLEFSVTVNRRHNFSGPVTLELVLPPEITGVKAEPVTVPADQNQAAFVIEVAGDATVGNHPFVNLRAKTQFNGQAVEVDQTIPLNIQ